MDMPGRQIWIKGLKWRILRRVPEYQNLNLVEGSTPSEAEKVTYGGAPATQGVFVPTGESEKKIRGRENVKKNCRGW
jgi:hypothetical protein